MIVKNTPITFYRPQVPFVGFWVVAGAKSWPENKAVPTVSKLITFFIHIRGSFISIFVIVADFMVAFLLVTN